VLSLACSSAPSPRDRPEAGRRRPQLGGPLAAGVAAAGAPPAAGLPAGGRWRSHGGGCPASSELSGDGDRARGRREPGSRPRCRSAAGPLPARRRPPCARRERVVLGSREESSARTAGAGKWNVAEDMAAASALAGDEMQDEERKNRRPPLKEQSTAERGSILIESI